MISKLFEKAIYNQVHDFLQQNDLYNKNKYRFRKEHSTELEALELVDWCISEMDNGDISLTIHMDLSKNIATKAPLLQNKRQSLDPIQKLSLKQKTMYSAMKHLRPVFLHQLG